MNTPYTWENRTYLVLTDSLTSLIAGVIDSILVSGSSIIIGTSNQKTRSEIIKNIGITPFLIPVPGKNDNRSFFYNNMPGSMEDLEIESFPLWKGLSADRLRFWQVNNELLKEFISKISFDTAVIDFDLLSPLSSIWEEIGQLIILKNQTLRTPEHFSFLVRNRERVEYVVTDKEMDVSYLSQADLQAEVWSVEKEFEPPIEKVYGLDAIYYDKRYIWQFNEYFDGKHLVIGNTKFPQAISFDSPSIELFPRCHPNAHVQVVPPNTITTPKRLIMFAYDEEVIDRISPKEVLIYDPYNVNRAVEMSVGDERVVRVING